MDEIQTLDELDPPAWGPPNYDSGLVIRCHELRKKPLGEFTKGDLRIMIGQQISLSHLIPRAIKVLETNPLAEGDYYPGELLRAVLGVDNEYWHVNPEQRREVDEIIDVLLSAVDDLAEPIAQFRAQERQ